MESSKKGKEGRISEFETASIRNFSNNFFVEHKKTT
jgi:hypothetical protein